MKKILLIGCIAILALLSRPAHAQPLLLPTPPQPPSTQNESGGLGDLFSSLFGNLFGSLTTLRQDGPTLEILPVEQPQVILAPEGVIVPVATIKLRGKNGGSEVDGLSVEFHWARETTGLENGATDMEGGRGVYRSIPIDGYVLLDGNTPLGPVQTVDYYSSKVIMNRAYIGSGDTKTITVGALMKASLVADMGKYFSVRITDVTTTATVSGTLPIDGGLKNISDMKAGRLGILGTVSTTQSAYPLISGQTGMEIHMTAGLEGEFQVPTFVVDARCLGGTANDVQVSLRSRIDGKILAGPRSLEASMLYGQGSVKFQFPFRVAMDLVADCAVTYRLGESWIDGGTIAFSVDKSKCIALGTKDGFLTIPLPIEIISGPLIYVLPVATEFTIDQVAEIDTGSTLVPGRNNLAAISITAPADKPLAIQGLGGYLGWSPYADTFDNVNIFGFLTYSGGVFSQPILGLRSDGSFLIEGVDMKGMRNGYTFWPQGSDRNPSAAIIPTGVKAYFVLPGTYKPTSAHGKVSAEIFDWNTEETYTLQPKSR